MPQPGTRRPRHVGGRQLEGPARRQRLAVLLHDRRSARPPLSSRSRRPSRAPTAAIARARTCSATRSSPSTFRPAPTSGTSRRSITISGIADPPAPPGLFDVVRNGTHGSRRSGVTTKSGYLLHPQSRDRPADLRRRGTARCRKSDVPGEATSPDAADSGEAAAARARHLHAGGSRHRRRHDAGTREGVRRARSRRSAASTTRDRSRRGCSARRARRRRPRSCFPGGLGGAQLGRHRVRSQTRDFVFVATQDVGALGWMETARDGSPGARTRRRHPAARTFDVRIGDDEPGRARNRHGDG